MSAFWLILLLSTRFAEPAEGEYKVQPPSIVAVRPPYWSATSKKIRR